MPLPEPVRVPPSRLTAEEFRALAAGRRAPSPRRRNLPRLAASGMPQLDSYRLVLPFLPPSVNKLFTTIRDPETGTIRRALTSNARKVRRLIRAMVGATLDPDALYELHIQVYLSAWTKTGKVRRVDLTNRVKFLEDSVCEALGIDDSRIFRVLLEKHDSAQERTVLALRAINDIPDREAA